MHEKVREYLEKERQGQSAADRREREETLLRLGLWEKEYEPEEIPTELLVQNSTGFTITNPEPVILKDEEYKEMIEALQKELGL